MSQTADRRSVSPPQKSDASGIDWVFFADTLNFSFWMPEDGPQYLVTYRGTTHTGYLAMCAAINRALDSGVRLTDPKYFVDIDQLTRILVLCGTPNEETLNKITSDEARNYIRSLSHMERKNFSDVFKGANPLGKKKKNV